MMSSWGWMEGWIGGWRCGWLDGDELWPTLKPPADHTWVLVSDAVISTFIWSQRRRVEVFCSPPLASGANKHACLYLQHTHTHTHTHTPAGWLMCVDSCNSNFAFKIPVTHTMDWWTPPRRPAHTQRRLTHTLIDMCWHTHTHTHTHQYVFKRPAASWGLSLKHTHTHIDTLFFIPNR